MRYSLLILIVFVLNGLKISAQSIDGYTTLSIDPSSLSAVATCETDLEDGADDGTLASRVTCTVADENGNKIASGINVDNGDRQGSASVRLTFQATAGMTYFAEGVHAADTTTPYDSPDYPAEPYVYLD